MKATIPALTNRTPASLLAITMLSFLLVMGCSDHPSATVGPISAATAKADFTPSKIGYRVDDTILGGGSGTATGPAPGLEFLPMPSASSDRGHGSLDDDDEPECEVKDYHCDEGKEVKKHDHGCYIPPWALDHDEEISVCIPDRDLAIVDFGPHPTQFNFGVMIWISFKDLDWDRHDPETWEGISMWYVNDNDEWEQIPHFFDWEDERVVGITNHFSRYVIARQSTR